MADFQDAEGRIWTLRINIAGAKRVRDRVGEHIMEPMAAEDDEIPLSARLVEDNILLADMLCALLQPQMKDKGVDRGDLEAALDGEALDGARTALFTEIRADLEARGRTDALRALDRQDEVMDALMDRATERVENMTVETIIERAEARDGRE